MEIRPLKAEEVEVRVGTCSEKGATLLLYKDARCDMRILDETFGPFGWSSSFEEVRGELFCTIEIKGPDGLWVSKQSNGSPSNMEAEKGRASDAFKRAGFMWGIGRELYSAPFIFVPASKCEIKKNRQGKPTCYERFEVEGIEVKDGRIVRLAIRKQDGPRVFYWIEEGYTPKKAEQC